MILSILREKAAKWAPLPTFGCGAGRQPSTGPVVGMAGHQGHGAVELFHEHDANQLVRPGGGAKGQAEVGVLAQVVGNTVRAADEEYGGGPGVVAPAPQGVGKAGRAEVLAALVEQDRDGSVGNELRQGDRFLGFAAVGLAGAAFRDLNQLDLLERSEEHTSELQSLRHLVCRLLLEKKNI